jgi:hypothetical protein
MARLIVAEVTAEVGRKLAEVRRSERSPIPPAQASASAPLPRAVAGLRETSEARMGRRKTTKPDPSVDVSSSHTYRIQAMVDGLDQLALAMEREWGVDRLRLLVSDLLSAKFDEQKDRLDHALATNNEAFVRAQVEGMRRAWTALDRAACDAGDMPLAPQVWECVLPDTGEIVSLVPTEAEDHHVARTGRVFTLAAILIASLGNGVLEAKKQFPERWSPAFGASHRRNRSLNDDIPF